MMRYQVLATDYDGTLAHDGMVDAPTLDAVKRFRDSGRHVVLVTGRELEELKQVFPQYELFELIVAENGALLYRPSTQKIKLLCEAEAGRTLFTLGLKSASHGCWAFSLGASPGRNETFGGSDALELAAS